MIDPIPLEIEILPCFRDHHFGGRVILPAVEALQLLAASTSKAVSKFTPTLMGPASFDKFLVIDPETRKIEAQNRLEIEKNGEVLP